MDVLERTRDTAKKRGLNLSNLAEKAGLSTNSIYKWKTSNPKVENLKAVADVLGVSVDYLLGNTDEPTTKDAASTAQSTDLSDLLSEEGIAMFDGQPLSEEYKRALLTMLRANRGQ